MIDHPIYRHRLWRTAIHETGHVLMALKEARLFSDVSIWRGPDVRSLVGGLTWRSGDDAIMRIALGGIVAVCLCRQRWDDRLFDTAHDDLGFVADILRMRKGPADETLTRSVRETVRMMLERWGALENLAIVLLHDKWLPYQLAVELSSLAPALSRVPRCPRGEDDPAWDWLMDRIRWRIKYPDPIKVEVRRLQSTEPSNLDPKPQLKSSSRIEQPAAVDLARWSGRRTLH